MPQEALMNLGILDGRGSFEEIEVAAFVGLAHVTRIELTVAARIWVLAGLPRGAPRGGFLVADPQRQPPLRDVELDDVTVADEREGTADERFRGDMQYARAVAGPAHPRVRDAHHVADTLREELLRDR